MNKGQIRTQFLQLLNRNDCGNDLADTFIEQGLARIQRVLRVPSMEKVMEFTASPATPSSMVLPSDFLQLKHLYSDDRLLEYKDLGGFLKYSTLVAPPAVYTRLQGELRIRPTPPTDTSILLVYYGEIPDLANDAATNFVTEIAPELLVNAALVFACDYFVDERKSGFNDTYSMVLGELQDQAERTEMEQSGMAMSMPFPNAEF